MRLHTLLRGGCLHIRFPTIPSSPLPPQAPTLSTHTPLHPLTPSHLTSSPMPTMFTMPTPTRTTTSLHLSRFAETSVVGTVSCETCATPHVCFLSLSWPSIAHVRGVSHCAPPCWCPSSTLHVCLRVGPSIPNTVLLLRVTVPPRFSVCAASVSTIVPLSPLCSFGVPLPPVAFSIPLLLSPSLCSLHPFAHSVLLLAPLRSFDGLPRLPHSLHLSARTTPS